MRVLKGLIDRLLERNVPLIFHNAAFDTRLLGQTARKWNTHWTLTADQCVCTMLRLKESAGIVSKKTGKLKNPGNEELYKLLHGKPPNFGSLHDAATDVRITAGVFVKAKSFGWLV